jgi:carotenoid cleavage dioxygenase-like enzyme
LREPAAPKDSLRWRGVYQELSREHGWEPLRVEGRLPPELRGTLYRNGPALFSSGGKPYLHAFDGDGAISAVRIDAGRAWGAVRVIDTRWLKKERAAGGQLYRSYAQFGRGWRRWGTLPKNPANISVLPWNGQLLALWEAGKPIALSPDDLTTQGETTLGGVVAPTFSAHPHAVDGRLFNFGVRYGRHFSLKLYELASDVRLIGEVPLRFPTLIHDFVPTARHFVFLCPPRRLDVPRLLAGVAPFVDTLRWEADRGSEILVVPRSNPDRPVRFEVPAFFLWHIAAAWEEGDEIVVDFVRYADDATDGWFGRAPWRVEAPASSAYVRARIDLRTRRFHPTVLCDTPCEFPGVDPRRAGTPVDRAWILAWMGGVGAIEAPRVARLSTGDGTLQPAPMGESEFPGEPIVIPRTDGDCWIASLVYDGDQNASYLAVWDGARWPEPPVARLWFQQAIPLSYHGAWSTHV